MARRTKAELAQENEELRRKVALLEETVHRLVMQPLPPQIVPIVVPCPCPPPVPPATPNPWRVVPFAPYIPTITPTITPTIIPTIIPTFPQGPLYPQSPIGPNPLWPQMPEIICDTTSVCTTH